MLQADGSIKMMDFGIARFSRAQSQTVSDKAIGSVHYISPEQAKGDHTDARTDIYSVGVMMYEMLSGKLPFDGTGAVSIAIMQISEKPKPLAEVAQYPGWAAPNHRGPWKRIPPTVTNPRRKCWMPLLRSAATPASALNTNITRRTTRIKPLTVLSATAQPKQRAKPLSAPARHAVPAP